MVGMGLANEGPAFDWMGIAFGLLGGLALFLYGLDKLSIALKAVAGERIRPLLAALTRNRWIGMGTGALITALVQSSSVTTVLVVGLISAGVMTLTQAIAVIFGANIGSTFTAQLIAFRITEAALPMIAAGFGVAFLARRDGLRHWGTLLMGLGLVFFGMGLMGEAMYPLRSDPVFLDLMRRVSHPALGIVVGTVFTALVQSSAATTGIVIVMASQGLISLEGGIAVALGANVGTCVTALLAVIGKQREAVRAALVHVLFNVLGVVLWVGFIPELAALAVMLSPSYPELAGSARRAAEVPRQIANAHTLFNVINTIVFIGFVDHMARLVTWMVPARPEPLPPAVEPQFLREELISTPTLALDAVQAEIGRLGGLVERMMRAIMPTALNGTIEDLRAVEAMDGDVDALHAAIVDYMRQVGRQTLSDPQAQRYVRLMEAANALEQIGDIIETDLVQTGVRRAEGGVQVSVPTQQLLTDLHERAYDALRRAVQALTDGDADQARRVVAMKQGVAALAHQAAEHGARRLVADAPNRLRAYTREVEVIEKLRRIYYFAKRIARTVLEAAEPQPQASDIPPDARMTDPAGPSTAPASAAGAGASAEQDA